MNYNKNKYDRCKWFGGDDNIYQIAVISNAYREKILRTINTETRKNFVKFTPWMTFFDKKDVLEPYFGLEYYEILAKSTAYQQGFVDSLSNKNGSLDLGLGDFMKVKIDLEIDYPNFILVVNEAKELLFDLIPWMRKLDEALVSNVIPVLSDQFERIGLSSHDLKSCIFLKISEDTPSEIMTRQLAVDYAHELAHQTLALFFNVDMLMDSPHDQILFSEIRGENRDAVRVFHSAAALAYEVIVLEQLLHSCKGSSYSYFNNYFIERRNQLRKTTNLLYKECSFTEVGQDILSDFMLFAAEDL